MFSAISCLACRETGPSPMYISKKAPAGDSKESVFETYLSRNNQKVEQKKKYLSRPANWGGVG